MRYFNRVAGIAVLIAAFYGSYSFVSAVIDRDPPIAYEGARAVEETVQRGSAIDIEFKVFRKRICEQVVKRYLTDATGVRHAIPSYTVGLQMLAGRETYQRSITVPTAAAIGPASYQVVIDYACNPLQNLLGTIRVSSPPISFIIVPESGLLSVPQIDSDG